eukprot:Clim_evm12s1 gene=Clim_evmTU12s1
MIRKWVPAKPEEGNPFGWTASNASRSSGSPPPGPGESSEDLEAAESQTTNRILFPDQTAQTDQLGSGSTKVKKTWRVDVHGRKHLSFLAWDFAPADTVIHPSFGSVAVPLQRLRAEALHRSMRSSSSGSSAFGDSETTMSSVAAVPWLVQPFHRLPLITALLYDGGVFKRSDWCFADDDATLFAVYPRMVEDKVRHVVSERPDNGRYNIGDVVAVFHNERVRSIEGHGQCSTAIQRMVSPCRYAVVMPAPAERQFALLLAPLMSKKQRRQAVSVSRKLERDRERERKRKEREHQQAEQLQAIAESVATPKPPSEVIPTASSPVVDLKPSLQPASDQATPQKKRQTNREQHDHHDAVHEWNVSMDLVADENLKPRKVYAEDYIAFVNGAIDLKLVYIPGSSSSSSVSRTPTGSSMTSSATITGGEQEDSDSNIDDNIKIMPDDDDERSQGKSNSSKQREWQTVGMTPNPGEVWAIKCPDHGAINGAGGFQLVLVIGDRTDCRSDPLAKATLELRRQRDKSLSTLSHRDVDMGTTDKPPPKRRKVYSAASSRTCKVVQCLRIQRSATVPDLPLFVCRPNPRCACYGVPEAIFHHRVPFRPYALLCGAVGLLVDPSCLGYGRLPTTSANQPGHQPSEHVHAPKKHKERSSVVEYEGCEDEDDCLLFGTNSARTNTNGSHLGDSRDDGDDDHPILDFPEPDTIKEDGMAAWTGLRPEAHRLQSYVPLSEIEDMDAAWHHATTSLGSQAMPPELCARLARLQKSTAKREKDRLAAARRQAVIDRRARLAQVREQNVRRREEERQRRAQWQEEQKQRRAKQREENARQTDKERRRRFEFERQNEETERDAVAQLQAASAEIRAQRMMQRLQRKGQVFQKSTKATEALDCMEIEDGQIKTEKELPNAQCPEDSMTGMDHMYATCATCHQEFWFMNLVRCDICRALHHYQCLAPVTETDALSEENRNEGVETALAVDPSLRQHLTCVPCVPDLQGPVNIETDYICGVRAYGTDREVHVLVLRSLVSDPKTSFGDAVAERSATNGLDNSTEAHGDQFPALFQSSSVPLQRCTLRQLLTDFGADGVALWARFCLRDPAASEAVVFAPGGNSLLSMLRYQSTSAMLHCLRTVLPGGITRCMYFMAGNGRPFGIIQYLNVFTERELAVLEQHVHEQIAHADFLDHEKRRSALEQEEPANGSGQGHTEFNREEGMQDSGVLAEPGSETCKDVSSKRTTSTAELKLVPKSESDFDSDTRRSFATGLDDRRITAKRLKIFYGHRYVYRARDRTYEDRLYADVASMPELHSRTWSEIATRCQLEPDGHDPHAFLTFPEVQRLEQEITRTSSSVQYGPVASPSLLTSARPQYKAMTSSVINVYLPGGGLGLHTDSMALFDTPIVSLKLFGESDLCFGGRSVGKVLSEQKFSMPRNCVTLMYGYAALGTRHCVRGKAVPFNATLLWRRARSESLIQATGPTAAQTGDRYSRVNITGDLCDVSGSTKTHDTTMGSIDLSNATDTMLMKDDMSLHSPIHQQQVNRVATGTPTTTAE